MKRLKHYIELELAYIHLGIYTLTEYPLDSVIWSISMLVREATGFVGILLMAKTLGGLGGWDFYSICVLFGLAMIPEALGQAFMDSVWSIASAVRKGIFDIYIVKPAPILMQFLGQRFNMQALVTFITGIVILTYGWINVGIACISINLFFMVEFTIFGTILNTSVYLIFNSLNFWIVQGRDIADLVLTFRQFAKYPLHIFPQVVRITLIYVIPFGFISYYPAQYLLKKTEMNLPLVLPVVAIIVMVIAGTVWRRGIKGYNSTGT